MTYGYIQGKLETPGGDGNSKTTDPSSFVLKEGDKILTSQGLTRTVTGDDLAHPEKGNLPQPGDIIVQNMLAAAL